MLFDGSEVLCCFFFSSRRRHTRLVSDWSSDVCSSDLFTKNGGRAGFLETMGERVGFTATILGEFLQQGLIGGVNAEHELECRSEERRVGKECRSRWSR